MRSTVQRALLRGRAQATITAMRVGCAPGSVPIAIRGLSTAEPSQKRAPLRYEAFDWLKRVVAWKAAIGAAVFLGSACIAGYAWYTQGPSASEDTVLHAFEQGVGASEITPPKVAVTRSELHDTLTQVLRPVESQQYVLIVGEHGTGKSTAVRKAAREVGTDGTNGVLYFLVPEEVTSFATGLAELVGFRTDPLDVEGGVRRRVSQTTKEEAQPALVEEPRATWVRLKRALTTAAKQFRAKHGRPATLVLDGVDYIAKGDEKFMGLLQDFAKNCADAGDLRVVFVSSDGTAPAFMMGRSAWSRAANPSRTEVGDIPDADARTFLVNSGIKDVNVAARLVDRITGGRFELLIHYADLHTMDAVEAKVAELDNDIRLRLRSAGVTSDESCFQSLVAAGTLAVPYVSLVEGGLAMATLDALIKANIIAVHPGKRCTFHSRYVERYFQKALALPPRLPHDAKSSVASGETATAISAELE